MITMMNLLKPSLVLLSAATMLPAYANTLDDAKAIQTQTNAASASSQRTIDKSSAAAMELQSEIEQLSEEVKNLAVYRDHLASLVVSQESEISSLQQQIVEINQTRQGIVPLMYQMIDGLQTNLSQDKPIRLTAREDRIEKLKALMPRADVSDAEKYRRILEAYQIEMDYGSKLGIYQDKIQLADNDTVEADILYLGRVALIARNLNATKYWSWDQKQQQWLSVESGNKADLDTAFNLANQQIAPTLLTLPVSLTKAEAK